MSPPALQTFTFDLELKNTFRITHGARDFQPTLIVKISHGEFSGYGEAVATSYYGQTVEEIKKAIEGVKELVLENLDKTPERLWEICEPELRGNSFAQCALDIAIHDLYGKRNQQPLYTMWGYDLAHFPLTNYTIGVDSVEKMLQKMQEFPWPLYKIKLGTDHDVDIVRELRKHSDAIFRVDANGAWTAEETIKNAVLLKALGVEFIEQPLAAVDIKGMAGLKERCVLPLIADESCIKESDVKKCAPFFDGINIKLTKCGGLTPARRMIAEAKELGLKVMVGCMTESSIGISAIAHLLPALDYVDMDGAMLLKNDIGDGVKIYNEQVHFPNRNGTGARLLYEYDNQNL